MAYNGKYAKPSDSFGYGVIRTLFILVCLLVLSLHMMSGLLAKYNATGSGSDEARVAAFEVIVSGNLQSDDIVCTALPTGSTNFSIQVQNNSEVAVKYYIVLEYNEAKYLTPTIQGADSIPNGTSGYKFTDDEWILTPGALEATHDLVFTVNWDEFTKLTTNASKAETSFNYTITVFVEQID